MMIILNRERNMEKETIEESGFANPSDLTAPEFHMMQAAVVCLYYWTKDKKDTKNPGSRYFLTIERLIGTKDWYHASLLGLTPARYFVTAYCEWEVTDDKDAFFKKWGVVFN